MNQRTSKGGAPQDADSGTEAGTSRQASGIAPKPAPFAFDVFVIHATGDEAFVRGSLVPSLGLPRERVRLLGDLPVGVPIAAAIEESVSQSRLTVAVLSPAYLRERWTAFGDQLAAHAGGTDSRLVPLLLEPCELPLHLDFLVALDFRNRDAWEGEAARLRARLEQPAPVTEPIDCPYPGLRSFEAGDAARFHGRSNEVDGVLGRLRSGETQILIVGPSGSGKSSFVKAGVLPRIGSSALFVARTMQPGAAPARSLSVALGEAASVREAVRSTLAESGAARLLVVVDQLEEFFTQCSDRSERERFASAYGELLADARCSIVSTLRADFYGELMESELWPHFGDRAVHVHLAALKGSRLAEAIEAPARAVGVYFEPSLRDRLVADAASEPGALPLLQVALGELWDKRRHNYLRVDDYVAMGQDGKSGLALALEHRADAVLHRLTREEQTVAQRVFLRLVAFGEGRAPTRRQQPVTLLGAAADDPARFDTVLGKLTEGRLLTGDTKKEGAALVDVVDLAHEALLTAWPAYATWIETRRVDEQRRRTLEAKAAEWVARGGGDASLLDVVELAEAERWMASEAARELGYGPDLSRLVHASREELRKQDAIKRRRRRLAVTVVAGFSLALSVLAFTAFRSSRAATRMLGSAYQEEGRALLEKGRPMRAIPYLTAARENDAQGAALPTLFARASSMLSMLGATCNHAGVVKSARFSPDGTRVVTASYDKTARVWDVATGEPVTPPLQHQDLVVGASFSPDGTRVVTASNDHTARVWDAATGKALTPQLEHRDNVHDASFSPDGARVVTASRDGTARVWDAATGKPLLPAFEHAESVDAASFSSDGARVLTAGRDKTARIWDAATGRALTPPLEHRDIVVAASFSRDGKRVVTASWDKTASVWDAATGRRLVPPFAHGGKVWAAAFSPDGERVVTASEDQTARVWSATTGDPITAPLRHEGGVIAASFSPDGARVVTGSWDKSARVWDAATGKPLTPLLEHRADLGDASFSPDGARVVTASWDHAARVWNVPKTDPPMVEVTHQGHVTRASFSPDGTRVATASDDKTARVWDARQGTPVTPPIQHRGYVHAASFSPDGARLVTGSDDKTARVWDANTGFPLGPPLRHLGGVWAASFSPDGARVVTASEDGTARVWDAKTGLPLGPPLEHRAAVWAASFSPDGARVLTGSKDHTARLWDAGSGRALTAPLEHGDALWTASFSPDGTRVVTASEDRTARVWNAITGAPQTAPLQHQAKVRDASFSRDGTRVVTASEDGTARVWDAVTGEPLSEPMNHLDFVNTAAFSPDGTRVATSSGEGAAFVWEAATGRLLMTLPHRAEVMIGSFSPDGNRLLTAGFDRTARVWDVAPDTRSLREWQKVGERGLFVLKRGVLVDNPATSGLGR